MSKRIMGFGGRDIEEEMNKKWPLWIPKLLETNFFGSCEVHVDSHKSECNMFCLDCVEDGRSFCSICLLTSHKNHRTIQIRRSSYHDVIRVNEIEKYMEIKGVQSYIINSARIVFLNQRPQSQSRASPSKPATNACFVCGRNLLHSFSFCSIACKINGASQTHKFLNDKNSSDSEGSMTTRKRKIRNFLPSTLSPSAVNYRTTKRRKGIPRRAPLGSLILQY